MRYSDRRRPIRVDRLPVLSFAFSNGPRVVQRSSGGQEHQMSNGTIKNVASDRGFGFIAAEDGQEYFFHRSSVDSTLDFDRLSGGESVTFEVEASPKGPRAGQVRAA
jgi:CspA family cold shock protein